MWIKVLWLVGAAWIFQGILVYFQIRNFQAKMAQLRKKGRIGVGTVKSRLGSGVIIIIVAGDTGMITEAQIMTGMTVFARFTPFEILQNRNLDEIPAMLESENLNKKTKTAITKAVDSLVSQKSKEVGGDV